MKLLATARRALRNGQSLILAKAPAEDPLERPAWTDAVSLWNALFAPFAPLIEDADVGQAWSITPTGRASVAALPGGRAAFPA